MLLLPVWGWGAGGDLCPQGPRSPWVQRGGEETGSARGFPGTALALLQGWGPHTPLLRGVVWGPWGGFADVGWFEAMRWFRTTGNGCLRAVGCLGSGAVGTGCRAALRHPCVAHRVQIRIRAHCSGCDTESRPHRRLHRAGPILHRSPAGSAVCGAVWGARSCAEHSAMGVMALPVGLRPPRWHSRGHRGTAPLGPSCAVSAWGHPITPHRTTVVVGYPHCLSSTGPGGRGGRCSWPGSAWAVASAPHR